MKDTPEAQQMNSIGFRIGSKSLEDGDMPCRAFVVNVAEGEHRTGTLRWVWLRSRQVKKRHFASPAVLRRKSANLTSLCDGPWELELSRRSGKGSSELGNMGRSSV